MLTRIGQIQTRLRHNLATAGTTVTLHWTEKSGGTVDPVTGALIGATEQAVTSGVAAFVHFVGATSSVRMFTEVEEGDLIVDFDPDLDLTNMAGLAVEVGGKRYHPKKVSDRLARHWDVIHAGIKLHQTGLFRVAT